MLVWITEFPIKCTFVLYSKKSRAQLEVMSQGQNNFLISWQQYIIEKTDYRVYPVKLGNELR
jgi:hypothetical protein